MPTLQELLARQSALEKERAEIAKAVSDAQRGQRADAIASIKTMMSQYGLSLADISGKGKATAPVAAPAPAAKAKTGRGPGKPLGKVAAKYRDTVTGNTWSGRGLQPNWLKAALATGRTLDDFRI